MGYDVSTALSVTGQQNVQRALKGVSAAMNGMGRSAVTSNLHMKTLTAGLRAATMATKAVAMGAGLATGAVAGLGVNAVKTAAKFQTMQAQLDAVMGSAAGGKQAFSWLEKMEPKLPGNLEDLTRLFTLAQTFKINPMANLTTIMDASLGEVERAERMIIALGQMKNNRIVMGEELNQLTDGALIPAKEIIAQRFKLTEKQLQNIGNVRLPADSAIAAILDWSKTNRGGSAMRQMSGIAGKLSSLQSAWTKINRTVGLALAPMAMKAIDRLTAWLNDPKTAQGALKFTSYLVAGIEMSVTLGERFTKALFDRDAMRKWGLQMTAMMAKLAGLAVAFKATMFGVEMFGSAFKSGKNPIAGLVKAALGMLALPAGMAGMEFLNNKSKELSARADKITTPNGGNIFKGLDPMGRAAELQAEWAKGVTAAMGAGPSALPGMPGGPAAGSGARMSLGDQIILWGGGNRAHSTRTGMDLGAYVKKPAGIPEIRIKVDMTGKGGPMENVVRSIAQDVSEQVLAEVFRSPGALGQMRNALGV